MYFFFDILKISSVIETWNSYWTNKAIFVDAHRQKQALSLIKHLLHLRLVIYLYENKFRQTKSQQVQFFVLLDKKQYKTLFEITVISLLRLVNSNLEILLMRKKFIKNNVITWLLIFTGKCRLFSFISLDLKYRSQNYINVFS